MKTLVVASQKGGVGKTTLALNLGLAFAEAGHRLLLVDTDPQGAIGLSLSKQLAARAGFADCIAGEARLADTVVPTRVSGLSLLPLGRLAPSETQAFAAALADGTRLARLLEQAEGEYDMALIDTPCGFGGITEGALRAATHVVSPIQAEPIAFRSVDQMLQMVKTLAEQGANVRVAGFVITMLQNTDDRSLSVARDIWGLFPRELLFDAPVPRDPVFLEATAAGVPVGLVRSPRPAVTHVFDLVAAELATRMELVATRQSDGPGSLLV